MRLYGFYRSTATWRVRIGLALKQIGYDYAPINLQHGEGEQHGDAFGRVNPLRQVPVLEFEVLGVVHRLSQSVAILEYLEERYPEPALLPKAPELRAQVRSLVEIVNSGIQPLQDIGVQRHVRDALGGDPREWARRWVKGLVALEAAARESAGEFSVGDSVTLADAFLVPQLAFARRFDVDLVSYPTLMGIDAACAALPAFQAAHADNQPDAVP